LAANTGGICDRGDGQRAADVSKIVDESMPKKIRIWNVHSDDGQSELREVSKASVELEEHLEKWLEEDITILDEDLLVIGRQVPTDFGGKIDLLCLDRNGDLVIIELKRGKTPREVVAQALDYASWGVDFSRDELETQAESAAGRKSFDSWWKQSFWPRVLSPDSGRRFTDSCRYPALTGVPSTNVSAEKLPLRSKSYLQQSLDDAFHDSFDAAPPDVLNEEHRLLIVGAEIDAQSERIIEYLSDEHGVNVNAATFQYFEDEETGRLLARTFLIEPSQVEYRAQKKGDSKRKPDLSYEELREMADDRGVGAVYRHLERGLEPLFSTSTRRSAIAFETSFRDPEFDRKRGVVLTLIPKDSSEQEGLHFWIYTYRLAAKYDVEPDRIHDLLPENWTDWQYSNKVSKDWQGAEGYFTSDQEAQTFVEGMTKIVREGEKA